MAMSYPRGKASRPGVLIRTAWLSGLALLATTLLGSRAWSSIVMALDLSELVTQADHIAIVDVTSKHADWDAKHERILSTIELQVVERWKGQPAAGASGDRITVIQPGGTVGDLTMTVTGLSTFVPGERALVFLRGDATAANVLGMSQGKRTLRFEKASKTWMVHAPDLRQATLVKPRVMTPQSGAPAGSLVPAAPSVRETGLDDLRTRVKALLATRAR